MRYIVKLSYNGADFCGWQVQPHAPSVQAALEDALGRLLGQRVEATGAGRTDSGVNAMGYIAHFDGPETLDTRQLAYKLNAILPRSVVISDIAPAAPGFHARFDATRREYTYFLHRVKDPFIIGHSYQYLYTELDFGAMDRAAAALPGTHDFSCFEKAGADAKTSICTVAEAGWHHYVPSHTALMHGDALRDGEPAYWYFRIAADRFLRNMVRALVGTLLEVGRGKRSVEAFTSLVLDADPLAPKTVRRSSAGESAPGHALFLSGIDYPGPEPF